MTGEVTHVVAVSTSRTAVGTAPRPHRDGGRDMLKRFRLEVEGETIDEVRCSLDRYETALADNEARWYGFTRSSTLGDEELGRDVTDEVISLGAGGGFYQGRRVVHWRRIDTRQSLGAVAARDA